MRGARSTPAERISSHMSRAVAEELHGVTQAERGRQLLELAAQGTVAGDGQPPSRVGETRRREGADRDVGVLLALEPLRDQDDRQPVGRADAVGLGPDAAQHDGARPVDVVRDVLRHRDLAVDPTGAPRVTARVRRRVPRGEAKWRVLTTGTPRSQAAVESTTSAAVMCTLTTSGRDGSRRRLRSATWIALAGQDDDAVPRGCPDAGLVTAHDRHAVRPGRPGRRRAR